MNDSSEPASSVSVYKNQILFPMTDDLLMDWGLIPDDTPPLPPPSRWERVRRSVWSRYWGIRWRLAEIVAGQPIYDEWERED